LQTAVAPQAALNIGLQKRCPESTYLESIVNTEITINKTWELLDKEVGVLLL
jgi:hypothetical protein